MFRFISILSSLVLLVLLSSLALAGIPKLINYQGMLTDDSGTPLNGSYTIAFKIYNAESGGTQRWEETQTGVSVTNGLFNVILGSVTPINLDFSEDYWLDITVDGEALPSRLKFTSVGYAYRAMVSDSAVKAGVTGGGWTDDGTVVRLNTNSDNVGIGTSSPQYKMDVRGNRIQLKEDATGDWLAMRTDGGGLDLQFQGGNLYVQSATDGEHILLNPNNANSNVGIGTTGPLQKLHVAGTVQMNGFKMSTGASSGKVLTSDANGVGTWQTATGTVNGSGTINYIPKFTASSTVGNSVMYETGGKIGLGTTSPAYKLDVRGDRIQLKEDATGDWIAMRTDGDLLDFSFSGGHLYMQSETDSQHIFLNPNRTNSKVGIGTITPQAKLQVYSTISNWPAIKAISSTGGALHAHGKSSGAYFDNEDYSGYAYVSNGHIGITAYGGQAGGYFADTSGHADAYLGYYDKGIDAKGLDTGGRFEETTHGNFCRVAYDTYKTWGTGSNDFVQNHPYNKGQLITYAGLEGDEVGTYTRGHARLTNGEARVVLGETFKWVTNPDIGLSAHITPRGECEGLYVTSLTTSEMVVKEMKGGKSDIDFDYLVCGLRIGFEEASVVQERTEEAYIPSMKSHRDLYSKYPQLRHFNALERFKEMNVQMGKSVSDFNASQALRDAIHEFDPAIDKLPEREKP